MTHYFNQQMQKEKRRLLRQNQTYCEKLLWMYLRNRQLQGYKFRRQYSIGPFVIDFYCPELKFAIEVDGGIHEIGQQREYDFERQKYLEKFNIIFLRITNKEVLEDIKSVVSKIEKFIGNVELKKMDGSQN